MLANNMQYMDRKNTVEVVLNITFADFEVLRLILQKKKTIHEENSKRLEKKNL